MRAEHELLCQERARQVAGRQAVAADRASSHPKLRPNPRPRRCGVRDPREPAAFSQSQQKNLPRRTGLLPPKRGREGRGHRVPSREGAVGVSVPQSRRIRLAVAQEGTTLMPQTTVPPLLTHPAALQHPKKKFFSAEKPLYGHPRRLFPPSATSPSSFQPQRSFVHVWSSL